MSDYPIIFRADEVQATLDKRKTQARRVITPQPPTVLSRMAPRGGGEPSDLWTYTLCEREWKCPYGKIGDRLWVRENLLLKREGNTSFFDILYKADNSHCEPSIEVHGPADEWCMSYRDWHARGKESQTVPSIHMPKWAARIWLEITDIRVERVQDISEADAIAEGIKLVERRKHRSDDSYRVYLANTSHLRKPCDGPGYYYRTGGPTTCFQMLWDSINAKRGYSWESNPWVRAIEFKLIEKGGE